MPMAPEEAWPNFIKSDVIVYANAGDITRYLFYSAIVMPYSTLASFRLIDMICVGVRKIRRPILILSVTL